MAPPTLLPAADACRTAAPIIRNAAPIIGGVSSSGPAKAKGAGELPCAGDMAVAAEIEAVGAEAFHSVGAAVRNPNEAATIADRPTPRLPMRDDDDADKGLLGPLPWPAAAVGPCAFNGGGRWVVR